MKKNIIYLFSFLLALTGNTFTSSAQYTRNNAEKLISPDFLKQQITYLASDSLKGRNTPSPELDSAASYIARNFRSWGVKPVNGSYFQDVPICRDRLGDSSFLNIDRKGSLVRLSIKNDFVPYDFSSSASATAPVVFAGYGITAPEYNYDDYKNIDAKGKIVIVFRKEPRQDDSLSVFKGRDDTRYSSLREKMKIAKNHGAVGILIVNGPMQFSSVKARGYPWPSLSKIIPQDAVPLHLCSTNPDEIPAMHIGEEAVRQLFGSIDSLKSLQAIIEKDLGNASFELTGVTVSMHSDIITETRHASNVVGLIPGSDTVLGREIVIIGAHYDHVGFKKEHKEGEDYIFNGADDNASGTSGVMSLAYAFSQLNKKPKRSILFLLFAGEEKGLFGSKYYTTHPLFPLSSTVAMLNLDMISRNNTDSLYLQGARQSPDITRIVNKENKKIKFKLVIKNSDFLGGSDHYSFYKKNIPFMFFFSGLHKDYHQVSDDSGKSDFEKAARASRLVFLTAGKIANESTRYSVVPENADNTVND